MDEIKIKWEESNVIMESDSVVTTDEAIEYLKISRRTFLKYIRVGRIRAIKVGRDWRILQSELYRFSKEEKDFEEAFKEVN